MNSTKDKRIQKQQVFTVEELNSIFARKQNLISDYTIIPLLKA